MDEKQRANDWHSMRLFAFGAFVVATSAISVGGAWLWLDRYL